MLPLGPSSDIGDWIRSGAGYLKVLDVQNHHMTNVSTQDEFGHDLLPNAALLAQYQGFEKYSTPGAWRKS
jgi:hypothetical protein